MTRRGFSQLVLAAGVAVPAAVAGPEGWEERLGVMCQLGSQESEAPRVLEAARRAGFRRVMVNFAWDRVNAGFLRSLPGWLRTNELRCEALGAYVNCMSPGTVLMNTRAEDFVRALSYAGELGCRRLVAWTGSHVADLMQTDPRNFNQDSEDALVRFLEPQCERLYAARLTLCLESYITLTCPDATSMRRVLNRLPKFVTAVLDPPNLTPMARFPQRDEVLREMVRTLSGRIGIVHMKDFRLAAGAQGYELPGPLMGEMNCPLFVKLVRGLPADIPVVAEHITPSEFGATRRKLLPLFVRAADL
ncbi:MAG: TIM barrel protein [Bryobacteraceae bacterium]|nr:TIM barrel protein [Bryobacteraceae bacterium]